MNKKLYLYLAILGFLVQGDNTVISPILPGIANDLGLPISQAALAIAGYLIPFGFFSLIYGPLADRFGQRRIICAAGLGTAVFSSLSGLAFSLNSLLILRIINGMFAAGIIPITVSLIGDSTEGKTKQNSIGAYLGFTFLGQALGTALGGSLTYYISWRIVFILYGIVELIASYIVFQLSKDSWQKILPRENKKTIYGVLLKNQVVLTTLPLIFLNGFAVYGGFAYLGSHLKEMTGFNYILLGCLLSFFGLSSFIVGKYSGIIKNLMGSNYYITTGFLGFAGLFTYLIFINYFHSQVLLILALLAYGGTFILFQSAFITTVQKQAPDKTGTVMALVAFNLFCGGGTGTLVNRKILLAWNYNAIYLIGAVLFLLIGYISYFKLDTYHQY